MMKSTGTCLLMFVAGLLFVLFNTNHATAQTLQTYQQEVRDLYRQGKGLVQQRQFKRALIKFHSILSLYKQMRPLAKTTDQKRKLNERYKSFLFITGRTYHYDKQEAKAYQYYQKCLKERPKLKILLLIQKYLKELKPKLLGRLNIKVFPKSSLITVMNEQGSEHYGRGTLDKKLPPGRYIIKLNKNRYFKKTKVITLEPKQEVKRTYYLKSIPTEARQVRRRIPRRVVQVTPKKTSPTNVNAIVAFTTLGVAIVSGVVGGVFLSQASDEWQKSLALRGNADKEKEFYEHVDNSESLQTISWVFFGAAAISAGVSIYFFIRWSRAPKAEQALHPRKKFYPSNAMTKANIRTLQKTKAISFQQSFGFE